MTMKMGMRGGLGSISSPMVNMDAVLRNNANHEEDLYSQGSSAAIGTEANDSGADTKTRLSAATSVTGKVIEAATGKNRLGTGTSVISSVGSMGITLADKSDAIFSSGTSVAMKGKFVELPEDFGGSRHLQGGDAHGDAVSSVGSFAPTLATRRTCKTVATMATLRNRTIDVKEGDEEAGTEDALSSVGSSAPTLATKRTPATMATTASIKNKVISTPYEDEMSSVGSYAPTLATRKTTATISTYRNKIIEADMDDGMSSVGSAAPTLATRRSVKTTTTSFVNKSIGINNNQGDLVSILGSRAPTLGGKRGARKRGPKKKPSVTKSLSEIDSGMSFDHYASDMALLGGVLGRERLTSALEDVVGAFLSRGAVVGIVVWVLLLIAIVLAAPISSYQYMNAVEQLSNATLLVLMVGINFNRLGPYLVTDRNWNFLRSGAMTASCAVQAISIATVGGMFFLPTPVLIDPVTGVRTHLVRWAEFTSLSFLMTFLTEGIGLPLEDGDTRASWIVATMVALSTVCGGILPFCPNTATWLTVLCISTLLFSGLHLRLIQKAYYLWYMPQGATTAEKDDYERAKFSVKLLAICVTLWTGLVLTYLGCCVAYKFAEPGSFWANDWLILVFENCWEGCSKIGYLSILMEVHEQLFDDVSKTAKRLGELRTYMSAVWDASSDVVIICSKNDQMVNAAVSPAFFQMENAFGLIPTKPNPYTNDRTTLVMEVDSYEGSYRSFEMDLSRQVTREEASVMMKKSRNKARLVAPTFEKNQRVLADLVSDACAFAAPDRKNQLVMMKDFYYIDQNRQEQTLYCEAKVVQLKGKAVLITLRDITQRLQLDEAKKQLRKVRSARAINASPYVDPYIEPEQQQPENDKHGCFPMFGNIMSKRRASNPLLATRY